MDMPAPEKRIEKGKLIDYKVSVVNDLTILEPGLLNLATI